jgi:predicted NBD/HSP70 family sugar kinase
LSSHQRRLTRAAREIRAGGAVSRPELAAALDVNLSSASSLTQELIALGLVRRAGRGASSGGRPAELMEINPGFALAVGAEVSNRGISALLVDLSGRAVDREAGGVPLAWEREPMLELLGRVVDLLLRRHRDDPVVGVGAGVAGVMGREAGVSREFPNVQDWQNVQLGEVLRGSGQMAVAVDNDVRAATLAELRYGAGRGLSDFLYLHIGRGIALGTVIGGRLHCGAFRAAGELGHFQVDPDGPVCYCGSTGCLESVAAPPALLAQAAEALRRGVKTSLAERADGGESLRAEDLFAAAAQGDRLARNLVERAGSAIGRITAGLDDVLDPQALIMGGLLAGGADALARSIQAGHQACVMPLIEGTTEFRRAELGPDAPALGAATLIFEQMFEEPELLLNGLAAMRSRATSTVEKPE